MVGEVEVSRVKLGNLSGAPQCPPRLGCNDFIGSPCFFFTRQTEEQPMRRRASKIDDGGGD